MNRQQAGFTLIELISVIVILGILSAFAIPRFANLEDQARAATVEGLGGAVRSATALVHAVWLANGGTGATVTLEGGDVAVDARGYPTIASIMDALAEDPTVTGDFNEVPPAGSGIWTPAGVTNTASCNVTFVNSTAASAGPPAVAAQPPGITVTATDCS